MEEFVFNGFGSKRIYSYINKQGRNSLITIKELQTYTDVSYTYIRTIIANFCNRNILIRICRGLYYFPEQVDGTPSFPQLENILSFLAKRGEYIYCPKGEYARYILGLRDSLPKNIICHTTGKIKTINLENGISIKLYPKLSLQRMNFASAEVMILVQYLKDKGIEKIPYKEKIMLQNFLSSLTGIGDDLERMPSSIKKFIFSK